MDRVKIAYIGKHFGEEPPLTGSADGGAGGIFFSGCNLKCVFCQNHQISQGGMGEDYSVEEFARAMLDLQNQGAVNIDLVTPTIWHKQIKSAVLMAREQGLKIPILWNSNCYEKVSLLKEMRGIVDIYLPDFKYGDAAVGLKYSGIPGYPEIAKPALEEMLSQVGNLQIGENGIATRGVLVRHLVLPGQIENSKKVLQILHEIEPNLYVSLMNQYFPMHNAEKFPEINRVVTTEEFENVFAELVRLGFENGWVQDEDSREVFIPDFRKKEPFTL